MKNVVFSILTALPLLVSAEVVQVSGKVKEVWLFSENYQTYSPSNVGLAIIYMDTLAGACGTNYRRVAISTDHPLYQSVVSTALTAKTTDASIEIWHLDTCTIRNNAWDFGLLKLQ